CHFLTLNFTPFPFRQTSSTNPPIIFGKFSQKGGGWCCNFAKECRNDLSAGCWVYRPWTADDMRQPPLRRWRRRCAKRSQTKPKSTPAKSLFGEIEINA
ncbi:MAG: hypothetical protein K2F75_07815, partial [Paramuribaculum sp.]|nr:hypothetical protein [Paramuribaculum sp.]